MRKASNILYFNRLCPHQKSIKKHQGQHRYLCLMRVDANFDALYLFINQLIKYDAHQIIKNQDKSLSSFIRFRDSA